MLKNDRDFINDYIAFHIHSPLNTPNEDYQKFNGILFRAIKLNALYSVFSGVIVYRFLFSEKAGVLRGLTPPGIAALGTTLFCLSQFSNRYRREIYNEEALKFAKKFEKEVYAYNDHFRRIYGNK